MPVLCFLLSEIGLHVERLRAPGLTGQPLALATPENRVARRSAEAALYGIQAGQKAAGALALCDRLTVLPYDLAAYSQVAEACWNALAVESSCVEAVSPEECYALLTGTETLSRSQQLAEGIRHIMGLAPRGGLARTRLLAYLAAQSAEPGTVQPVARSLEGDLLAEAPISISGLLDRQTLQRLTRLGIHTLKHVREIPLSDLIRQVGQAGLRLHRMAQGEEGGRVESNWPPRQLEFTHRFEEEVTQERMLEEALRRCAAKLSRQLQARREYSRRVTLVIRTEGKGGFERSASERLTIASDSVDALFSAGMRLYARLKVTRPFTEVRLALAEIGIGGGLQLTLMDGNDCGMGFPHERRIRLDAALEHVRAKHANSPMGKLAGLRREDRALFYTSSLGKRLGEPVTVETDAEGVPRRCMRSRRNASPPVLIVETLRDRWKETGWFWGEPKRTVFRFEAASGGLYELSELTSGWKLGAMWD